MHVSLDSALGRQRRLNSVGETITSIATPVAAYSLRSLTGGDPKVVRVRRDSDNDEQDFTASEVSSGALVDYVNSQVTKPLDVRELQSDGRTGDFVIAKAAYSLRSLGDRQATTAQGDVPLDEDTVQAPSGKYVVQVRRSSDNRVKSFKADEVTDGTLVNFVNEEVLVNQTDASWTGWSNVGNASSSTSGGAITITGATASESDGIRYNAFLPLTSNKYRFVFNVSALNLDGATSFQLKGNANNVVTSITSTGSYSVEHTVHSGGWGNFINFTLVGSPSSGASITIDSLQIYSIAGNGFVRALYDQSVSNQAGTAPTGRHAIQSDSAKQASIVTNGALNASGGLEFDGTDDVYSITSLSFENKPLCVISLQDLQSSTSRLIIGNSSDDRGVAFKTNRTRHHFSSGTIDIDSSNLGSQSGLKLNTLIHDGTTNNPNVKAFRNGVELVDSAPSGNQGQANTSTPANQIGAKQSSGFLSGTLKELLIYDTDQTDNRGAFEANIAEHYNISGIPTATDTVNGFVETWYDQSGNNRPLIQTTATNQPLIVESGVFLNGVKANEATSNTDMMNLQVSTNGTTANFGTDDWASGASSKLGLIYVGTVLDGPNDENDAVVWGGGRGVNSYQAGGLSLQVIKAGTDNWKLMNEREGLSPEQMSVSRTLNTDADVVWYGTANNRDFTVNVNGSENTDTESADLDVREDTALSLFGAFGATGPAYYQRSSKGVCKECFLYAGDNITNVPAIATKINEHYSIY